MEPEGSFPRLQEPATCSFPEPDQSSPWPPQPTSLRFILILSFRLRLGLPFGLLPSGFPTKILYASLLFATRATCPAHLITVLYRKSFVHYRDGAVIMRTGQRVGWTEVWIVVGRS